MKWIYKYSKTDCYIDEDFDKESSRQSKFKFLVKHEKTAPFVPSQRICTCLWIFHFYNFLIYNVLIENNLRYLLIVYFIKLFFSSS